MKTPQQAAEKWNASTSLGEGAWIAGLQGTSKPIVAAAVGARAAMQANFSQATQPGGVWERRLEAIGDAGIKSAAAAKRANYTTGVSQAQPKFLSAIQKILAYEAAGLSQLASMPKGTLAQSKARAAFWIDYMAAGRGNLGA